MLVIISIKFMREHSVLLTKPKNQNVNEEGLLCFK